MTVDLLSEIRHYLPGLRDKHAALLKLAEEWGFALDDIAYVGDDVNDLGCLAAAGFACCPADAMPEVRAAADHVTTRPAGAGAVREVCDLLLRSGH